MIPYFVMVGIPAIIAIYFKRTEQTSVKVYRRIIDAFFVIWLILLLFRSESVGTDLVVYKFHFATYSELSWKTLFTRILGGEIEAGYFVLAKLISLFTSNFQWVIVVCALISVVPIWLMYRNNGSRGFLTVVLFLNIAPFVMYFSGLRQAMAMAFVVPAYKFCKEKNVWKYVVTVLIAFLFHKSALIIFLMYPIYHLRLKKQIHMLYIIPIWVGVYWFNVPIFTFLLYFLGGGYADEYLLGINRTGAYAVLLLLVVILIYTFLIPKTENLDNDTIGLRNILVFCVFLQIFASVHTIAMRMNYYFLLFVPLLIPRIIDKHDEKYDFLVKVSEVCMVVFFTVYYFYYAYTDIDILQVYPYVSMFSK